jgi:hypothetical protein
MERIKTKTKTFITNDTNEENERMKKDDKGFECHEQNT